MNKTERVLYWLPRILSILFICFLMLFSLDVFEPGLTVKEIALGLLVHNIPSIILIVLLVVAWRYEIVGAISFFGAGILYITRVSFSVLNYGLEWYLALLWSLNIALPAIIIGVQFLVSWKIRLKYR
jgi:hypothetical protein